MHISFKRKINLSCLFILILFIYSALVQAEGEIRLILGDAGRYVLVNSKHGEQNLTVNIPSDYKGNLIKFQAYSENQYFNMWYEKEGGSRVYNNINKEFSTGIMFVPVKPGKTVNLGIEVTGVYGTGIGKTLVSVSESESNIDFESRDIALKKINETPYGQISIYVNNNQDKAFYSQFYIDGILKRNFTIKSSTSVFLGKYSLLKGEHVFLLKWKENENEIWYEKKIKRLIENGKTYEEIFTLEDSYKKNEPAEINIKKDDAVAEVLVKNLDNNDVNIKFYIDNVLKLSKKIPPASTILAGRFSVSAKPHVFKLSWTDPNNLKVYSKEVSKNFYKGASLNITLTIPENKKQNNSAEMIKENKDKVKKTEMAAGSADATIKKSKEQAKDILNKQKALSEPGIKKTEIAKGNIEKPKGKNYGYKSEEESLVEKIIIALSVSLILIIVYIRIRK